MAYAHTPSSFGSPDHPLRVQGRILDTALTPGHQKGVKQILPFKMAKILRGQQIEAPLPADRVTPQKSCRVTEMDFARPLYIKVWSGVTKGYIAFFTCATTRAVHLELCTDMTTDKFLQALQRLVGKLGLPHTLIFVVPCIMLNSEIIPTRCNNCVYSSQWLYSTCFG